MRSEEFATAFILFNIQQKSPSLLGEGLGRGFYYAIQLVTPSDVPSAVRILISI